MNLSSLFIQFEEPIKFGLVGISGILVNFIILTLSLYILQLSDPISLAFAILVSLSTNYYFNRIWTFGSENPITNEYLRYVITNGIGIIIQYSLSVLLEIRFEKMDWLGLNLGLILIPSIFVASIFGILIGFIANFSFSKFFVFN